MSSFFNQLSQVETDESSHNNPHASPTPVDMAAAIRLLQSQFQALLRDPTSTENSEFLTHLTEDLDQLIENPPEKVEGVPQSYLDELERVPKKQLKKDDNCPICGENFLDDPYPLVVQLPCHTTHRFDLECVGPWLRLNGTCPLDRKNLVKKKEVVKAKKDDGEDEEIYDDLYA